MYIQFVNWFANVCCSFAFLSLSFNAYRRGRVWQCQSQCVCVCYRQQHFILHGLWGFAISILCKAFESQSENIYTQGLCKWSYHLVLSVSFCSCTFYIPFIDVTLNITVKKKKKTVCFSNLFNWFLFAISLWRCDDF